MILTYYKGYHKARVVDTPIGQAVEMITHSWQGSGDRYGTVHGKVILEFGFHLPVIHSDFDLGSSENEANAVETCHKLAEQSVEEATTCT